MMQVFDKTIDLQRFLNQKRAEGKSIGLVPTMGALHQGHLELVKRCTHENNISVASIFVNPTQFNDKKDLELYPRTPKEDMELLESVNCSVLFMPSVEEMYPTPDERAFDFGPLERVMEGAFRPGHFNGVAQIVSKLFQAVTPDSAYFGEKDFQQLAIIRKMTSDLGLPIQIVPCPIVREKDGLAMSSRNKRLREVEREKAPKIAEFLTKSLTFANAKTVQETIGFVINGLSSDSVFKMDYFEIVDGDSLQPVREWDSSDYIVGCIAVYCGPVRLIDNIVYKKKCL
jgi:pantoate--beta-alanine ligase